MRRSASTVAYSDEWQRVKTGQELLYVTFPTVLQKGRVKVINGLPTAAKGEPIINVAKNRNGESSPRTWG